MSKLNPFQLFIRQALLYPLASPFLPDPSDVRAGTSYAAGQLTGTLEAGGDVPILDHDIDFHVATDGSDDTGDGSSGLPFLTVQHALDQIPKNLGTHFARITIHDGTFAGFICSQFSGATPDCFIEIKSNSGNPDDVIFTSQPQFIGNLVDLYIENFTVPDTAFALIIYDNPSSAQLSGIKGAGSTARIVVFASLAAISSPTSLNLLLGNNAFVTANPGDFGTVTRNAGIIVDGSGNIV